jgi:hypothetical protein
VNDTFTVMRREDVPILTEVGDYAGQEAVKVSCTQLGTNHSASQARRALDVAEQEGRFTYETGRQRTS